MNRKKIKILMVGGKRCGKTTVLTSLYFNADKTLSGTDLSLETDNELMAHLEETRYQSEAYFEEKKMESFVRVSDDNANLEVRTYDLRLELAGKNTGIDIQFVDVPGEYFENPEYFEEVKKEIRESHVFIIAIDTPCLWEDDMDGRHYGPRHVDSNKSEHITHFFKTELTMDDIRDRMFLFVPIKCEKYYYNEQMLSVVNAVKAGYKELLDHIASPGLKKNCTAAVLPILSLGGLKFFDFVNDSESPTESQRYLFHLNDGDQAVYRPLYCDQPLLYTIAYILATSKGYRDGPIWKLRNYFFNTPDGNALRKELKAVAKKINLNEDEGFERIQDPLYL